MKIIDENGIEIVDYDHSKGYLKETEVFVKHHKAVKAVEEQGHYEVIAEYEETGGKDVEWVVDVPAVEAKEAFDEFEKVLQFVPYSLKELAEMRIQELKRMLADTDFHILKIVEGATTLAECAEIIKKRAAWRKEINKLEEQDDGNKV